jgi:transposase
MRKIREAPRLSALGLPQHQIARSCSIVQSTVRKYLKLAEAAQIGWPLPENPTNRELDQLLFGKRSDPPSRRTHPAPDFPAIRKELETHKDLTLELVRREYKQAQPDGYRYSRFCDLYRARSRSSRTRRSPPSIPTTSATSCTTPAATNCSPAA